MGSAAKLSIPNKDVEGIYKQEYLRGLHLQVRILIQSVLTDKKVDVAGTYRQECWRSGFSCGSLYRGNVSRPGRCATPGWCPEAWRHTANTNSPTPVLSTNPDFTHSQYTMDWRKVQVHARTIYSKYRKQKHDGDRMTNDVRRTPVRRACRRWRDCWQRAPRTSPVRCRREQEHSPLNNKHSPLNNKQQSCWCTYLYEYMSLMSAWLKFTCRWWVRDGQTRWVSRVHGWIHIVLVHEYTR